MAGTAFKPDISIKLLDDITAWEVWNDPVIQYGFFGTSALSLDTEFKSAYRQTFGNAKPDANFAFASLATRAFNMIDNVVAIDFERSEDELTVDLVLTSTNDKPKSSIEGFFQFPGDSTAVEFDYWSIGALNSGMGALKAKAELGGGQYANWTVLHEIGHSVGLMHTHDDETGNPRASVGKFMDNERYSVMSYNGAANATKYGHAVSLMALDIAALQALYGAETYAMGDSTYTLMSAKGGKLSLAEGDVQIGRAYYSIWDSGGNADRIDYAGGKKSVLINLNDATLDTSGTSADIAELISQLRVTNFFDSMSSKLRSGIVNELYHAGGFFSQVLDVKKGKYVGTDGGFSIANGATIEDATGGKANDLLIGNEYDNSINGLNGDDTILGGAGEDRLSGGAGKDWIDGGTGNDFLWGGAARDVFVFSTGYGTDTIMDFGEDDRINLKKMANNSQADIEQNGLDLVITFNSGDVLIVKNATFEEVNGHFIL
ncbi:M10 family metallopeptidase C-terminal domain-containing protein [Rhizobium sp.]